MVKNILPNRFDVYIINLDPTVGSEIKKIRPCAIVSPNEINHNINTVIIAPMSTKSKNYPTRVKVNFAGKTGFVVLDQIRTVDRQRLIEKKGVLSSTECDCILEVLARMFAR